jgi:hypothetical protein
VIAVPEEFCQATDGHMSSRRYSSFIVRCCRLDADVRRIKIEHIQSGLETQVTTLSTAAEWIGARWDGASKDE